MATIINTHYGDIEYAACNSRGGKGQNCGDIPKQSKLECAVWLVGQTTLPYILLLHGECVHWQTCPCSKTLGLEIVAGARTAVPKFQHVSSCNWWRVFEPRTDGPGFEALRWLCMLQELGRVSRHDLPRLHQAAGRRKPATGWDRWKAKLRKCG
ncbi:hypothetical protein BT63DRAFT_328940 [Microthyrium microscopicum]|uniref:Uncharacterized protein n=1 Tax=Microthyrium microscopicum TaxID=703497 RepID=A0A6A6U599_9PEZI|nr:hypothetical protein BT63DRAFT_328940 [Microthyrium microscopicum]